MLLNIDNPLKAVFKDHSLLENHIFCFGETGHLPICRIDLCKTGFSTYTYLKDKYRNRLNAVPEPRLPSRH